MCNLNWFVSCCARAKAMLVIAHVYVFCVRMQKSTWFVQAVAFGLFRQRPRSGDLCVRMHRELLAAAILFACEGKL